MKKLFAIIISFISLCLVMVFPHPAFGRLVIIDGGGGGSSGGTTNYWTAKYNAYKSTPQYRYDPISGKMTCTSNCSTTPSGSGSSGGGGGGGGGGGISNPIVNPPSSNICTSAGQTSCTKEYKNIEGEVVGTTYIDSNGVSGAYIPTAIYKGMGSGDIIALHLNQERVLVNGVLLWQDIVPANGGKLAGQIYYDAQGGFHIAGYWWSKTTGLWQPILSGKISPSAGRNLAGPSGPTCRITFDKDSVTLPGSASTTLTATVTGESGTVQRVEFVSSNETIATVNPSSDETSPYITAVRGLTASQTYVYAYAFINDVAACVSSSTITVTKGPWWRAQDGDLTTINSIFSQIPSTANDKSLILKGAGGYTGVGLYNDFSYFGGGYLATPSGWLVKASSLAGKGSSLTKQIPSSIAFNTITQQSVSLADLTTAEPSGGYYWNLYDGAMSGLDLNIDSDINLGTNKVVLLVSSANLNINGKINLIDGEGFFITIVGENENGEKGSILVNATVAGNPALEGIFSADNQFKTGAGTEALHIRGSVVAYGGVVMERDLADDTNTPAELFEFAPDQILLYPPQLNVRRYKWREVAP